MTTLYVTEEGSVVRRDGEQVIVTRHDPETRKRVVLAAVPARNLEQIVIYGYPQVTTQAIGLLARHEVDLVYFTKQGRYVTGTRRAGSKFARLRYEQLRIAGHEKTALPLALGIVQAKIAAQRNLLRTLAEQINPSSAGIFQQAARGVEEMRRAAPRAHTLDTLRGYEGQASALYFGALRQLFTPEWAFKKREYHPPPDPFNALLSFGYALLQKDVERIAHLVGLDPFVGCLHVMEMGRPSLVLDLMEEFRPLVVDQAMLHLVLSGAVTPTHFTFTRQPDRPVEIGQALMPTVVQAYESRLDDLVLHQPSREQNRLRRTLELQARIYARVVMGERGAYEGVVG